jgi:four helix bundle protein
MECFSYRKLRVYQQVKNFVICVYELLKCFPKEENYALCDQLRRSAMSIPSNIAEGMGRCSIKEQVHFIEIAFGSLNEVMCQIEISHDLGYITKPQMLAIEDLVKNTAKTLSGLRNKRLMMVKG